MVFKRSIQNLKPKLLLFMVALLISITTLQNTLTVYADQYDTGNINFSGWASSVVHSDGTSNTGGTASIQNGVTYQRTGYLCYLLTADGAAVPGTQAVAFKSPGYSELSGAVMNCTSRKGGYTATSFNGGTAPWGCTPWEEGGAPTNEPKIKAWFENMNGGFQNGSAFVKKHWGEDALVHYMNNEYIIIIETIMHFQYSQPSGNVSLYELASQIVDGYTTGDLLNEAHQWGYPDPDSFRFVDTDRQSQLISQIKYKLRAALVLALRETYGDSLGEGRVFVGPPVIGTVPNLLDFKASIGLSTNPFKSYTNKVAPFSEHAIADGVAERAGFNVWTGSTSSQISDADVKNYGLAMMIITASSDMQTTCNEPLIPSPHDPPKESDGKVTIVKSYRTKDPTGTLIEDGTYSTSDLGTQILIENEQVYQVIGWKTSTTTNTNISSINWNPPSSVVQQGTTPKSVTLQPQETCLYLLLEKVEEEEVEEKEWNYHLTQSQITRTVWFSNPDRPLTNMGGDYKIDTKPFRWMAMNHVECEQHDYQGPCSGHEQDCDCNNLQQSLF